MKDFLKKITVFLITLEARLILKKYKPTIVAVTGSVGKTTTKDAVYAVLESRYFVRKSEKSFNSELGVPLTILGRPNAWRSLEGWVSNLVGGFLTIVTKENYPKVLVLEVGADRPRDIENISRWLRPDVSVVTRLAAVPVHVEYFSSPEAVANEKLSLVRHGAKTGTAVYCFDDEMLRHRKEFSDRQAISFGFESESAVRGFDEKVLYDSDNRPTGMAFEVSYKGEQTAVTVNGVVGRQILYSLLGAIASGLGLGLSLKDAAAGLGLFTAPPGRMRLIPGLKDSLVIDDTYNSSPLAASAALSILESVAPRGRKIVVLGDMLELGKYSVEEHRALGKRCVFADKLVVVGVRSRDIAAGARSAKMLASKIKYFETSAEAALYLGRNLKEKDTVLVKGSQGMRMERVVAALLAEPEKKAEFLVRQDDEWAKR